MVCLLIIINLAILGTASAYASHSKTEDNLMPGVNGNPVASILNGKVVTDSILPEKSDIIPKPLRQELVSTITELMDAIKGAQPGDHITLKDGTYNTEEWLKENSADSMLVEDVDGTKDAPIVIMAETTGGAEIVGPGGFQFRDISHIVIKGFKFTHAPTEDGISIECNDCQHVRFTQNYFDLDEEDSGADDSSHWLGIKSEHSVYNRIDHNTFENKGTQGNYLLLLGSDDAMPKYNRIDHNYFHYHTYSEGNGGECLRIGNSAYATRVSHTIVEYNLFDQCNGDAEVISVKSSENVVRQNAFINNEGSVVLRHGNDNLVDGNLFVRNEGGVRVYGHNHTIVNNFFEGNYGEDGRQTLVIGSGTVESDRLSSNAEYSRAKDIAISNNTFVGNESNIVVGYGDGGLAPKDIMIGENAVRDGSALIGYVEEDD